MGENFCVSFCLAFVVHASQRVLGIGFFSHGFFVNDAQGDRMRGIVAVSPGKFQPELPHKFECFGVSYYFSAADLAQIFLYICGVRVRDFFQRIAAGGAFRALETDFAVAECFAVEIIENIIPAAGKGLFA